VRPAENRQPLVQRRVEGAGVPEGAVVVDDPRLDRLQGDAGRAVVLGADLYVGERADFSCGAHFSQGPPRNASSSTSTRADHAEQRPRPVSRPAGGRPSLRESGARSCNDS
jgi:hypothetical protein